MNNSVFFRMKYELQFYGKDGPGGEKTEDATSKKLKDARQDGKVAKSKELTAGIDLIILFIVLKIFVSSFYEQFVNGFQLFYQLFSDVLLNSRGGMTAHTATFLFREAIMMIINILLPVFIIGVIAAVFSNIIQVKWKPTAKPMKPKFSKLNPLSGFKRIFSKDSLFELVKSIAKVVLILVVAYQSVEKEAGQIFVLYDLPLRQGISLVGTIVINTGLQISLVYFILGLVDYIYQRIKFKEEMKMSKQEVKDEFKNTEGNPEIKGRQKQKMREVSHRRMMADVPKADVIITNPTHLAIALKYDAELSVAPILIAKGEDYLALKIREVAKEHQIEIVENKPLARMLYANVDVGAEVPPELYQAVAEVLALVYNKTH